jgi:hypothetical protein
MGNLCEQPEKKIKNQIDPNTPGWYDEITCVKRIMKLYSMSPCWLRKVKQDFWRQAQGGVGAIYHTYHIFAYVFYLASPLMPRVQSKQKSVCLLSTPILLEVFLTELYGVKTQQFEPVCHFAGTFVHRTFLVLLFIMLLLHVS